MRETVLHRWVGNHKDQSPLRQMARGVGAANHVLNWAHSDIRSSGEVRLLRALGPHLRVVFDVGAHDGAWAAQLLRAAPRCVVHCFEPSATTRAQLASRLGSDSRVVIAPVGLHATTTRGVLKEYPAATHLNSLADYPHELTHRWTDVQLEAGDRYADRHGIDVVDLLKVDTDGSEWDVLQGFLGRLGEGRIGAVQFEYGRVNIVVRRLLADFAELFENEHYELFRIRRTSVEPIRYTFDLETFFVTNFLAINRQRPDLLACVAR
jgi:FkbM family methyltransferase